MAQTNSERALKKSWECKHGCAVTRTPCPHLEKLLPAMNSGEFMADRGTKEIKRSKRRMHVRDDIETISLSATLGDSEAGDAERLRFITRLEQIDTLEPYHRLLLTYRFGYNWSVADIAVEIAASPSTVMRDLRKALLLAKGAFHART